MAYEDDQYANARQLHAALVAEGVPNNTAIGAVGSLMGESGIGLNPKSRNPGDGADGSDSINFGQWNGPRGQALMAYAQQNGLDPNSFDAGKGHLINELRTTHKGVLDALKAKDDIGYGTDVWTKKFEVPANADSEVQRRLPLAQQFARAIGGGGGTTALTGGAGNDQLTTGALSQPQTATTGNPKVDGGLFASLQRQGIGALFNQDPNASYDWRDSMVQLGAALMSRDKPEGAKVMAQSVTQNQTGAYYKSLIDAQKKAGISTKDLGESSNGKYRVLQVPDGKGGVTYSYAPIPKDAQQPEDDGKDKLTSGLSKEYFNQGKNLESTSHLIEDIQRVRKTIMDHDLKMNILKNGEAEFRNATGQITQDSVDIKDAMRIMGQLKTRILQSEAGPQTKAKMQQAIETYFPSGGQYDAVTFSDSANSALKDLKGLFGSHKDAVEAMTATTKGLSGKITTNKGESIALPDYAKQKYDAWNKDDDEYQPRYEEYKKRRISGEKPNGQFLDYFYKK